MDAGREHDQEERSREKRASRDQDERDLAEGRKTREQLRRENGAFAFPPRMVRIRFGREPRAAIDEDAS